MDIGSEVHDMIADYLGSTPKDQEEPIGKEITNAYTAFMKFFDDYEMETIEIEKRMVFPDWCGQLDWVGVLSGPKVKHPGELYVLDWKCSKRLYRETRVQTAAESTSLRIILIHTTTTSGSFFSVRNFIYCAIR
jgi:hypothetical protein